MKVINKIKLYVKNHSKLTEVLFLALVFLISFLVRRVGLKHGFPLLTHPDESAIIDPVLRMTKLHTLNPGNFNRPDQILQYLNLIYLNILSFLLYGKNVVLAFDEHYLTFYFHSRLLVAIMGSLIPVFAYYVGKEIMPRLAIPSAIVFSIFPLFVRHSLFITPDIPITLFTLIITYFAYRYLNTGEEKFLYFATFFVAVNTAEKYPGLLSFVIILIAIGLQTYNHKTTPHPFRLFILKSLKTGGVFLVSLGVIAPYLFIEYQSVIKALIQESRTIHLGADGLGFWGNLWFYVKTFSENFNILGGILMAAGTWKVVRSRNPRYLLILYSLGYWIALSFLALHWSRWSLPMDIAPLFLTALGIVFLTADENFGKIGKSLGQVIIVAFILILSIETIFVGIQMTYPDTRVISLQYCELENITKENAIYEGNSPLRPLYSKTIFEEYLSDHSDKKYLILSSFMYNNFFNERDRYEEEVDLYNEIRSDNQLLAEFSATPNPNNVLSQLSNIYTFVKSRISGKDPGLRKGPTIEIYLISD